MRRKPAHKVRPFSIGITGSYKFFETNSYDFKNLFFSDIPTIRIEPEYRISERFSIELPIVMGFGFNKEQNDITSTYPIPTYFYGSYSSGAYEYTDYVYWRYQLDHSQLPTVRDVWTSYSSEPIHIKELHYQGGVQFKWYPIGQSRTAAFYLGNSFNVGLGNINQVDIYATFDTITADVSSSWSPPDYEEHWFAREERAVLNRSNFVYFRYECAAGLDFHLSSFFNLSIEGGFSTLMLGNNRPVDRIFLKTPFDTDFNLIHEEQYDAGRISWAAFPGSPVLRFSLVVNLGKPKEW